MGLLFTQVLLFYIKTTKLANAPELSHCAYFSLLFSNDRKLIDILVKINVYLFNINIGNVIYTLDVNNRE
jgi:hypothetical protein